MSIPPGRHEFTLRPDFLESIPGSRRFAGSRVLLVRELAFEESPPGPALDFTPIVVPHRLEQDAAGRCLFWQGKQPTYFEIINSTGRTIDCAWNATATPGPNHPPQAPSQLAISWRGETTLVTVRQSDEWLLNTVLLIPPGRRLLALWSDTPSVERSDVKDRRDRVFLIEDAALRETTPRDELSWEYAAVPHRIEVDQRQKTVFWQGASPSVLEFRNPSGVPVTVTISAEALRGPNHPDRDFGRIITACDGQEERHAVRAEQRWAWERTLRIGPGCHEVQIWTDEVAGPPAYGSDPRDRIYLIRNLRVAAAGVDLPVGVRLAEIPATTR